MKISELMRIKRRIQDIDRMLGDTAKFTPSWAHLVEEKQKLLDKLRN